MSLEKLALYALLIVGIIVGAVYAVAIVIGVIATFPYGIPGLLLIGLFVFIFLKVVQERLSNKEDDYYEKNIKE